LDLAPGVLCPNGTLEAIARANPGSVEALQAIPELRRWQARVIGPSLFEALQEEQPAAG
ncbi:MAG: HRDC domain-containing protein, partial [Gemmatimonadetes bacterium]|nr:HRDC domain-containing protein [Gemmatimonadota bacterium]